jgi:hypothetical protein
VPYMLARDPKRMPWEITRSTAGPGVNDNRNSVAANNNDAVTVINDSNRAIRENLYEATSSPVSVTSLTRPQ